MTEIVISYRYVFPVVAGALVENHPHLIVPKEVYGTAFCLGGPVFATAAHVVEGARQQTKMALGFQDGDRWSAAEIQKYELFPEQDIALVKAEVPGAQTVKWDLRELLMEGDVVD